MTTGIEAVLWCLVLVPAIYWGLGYLLGNSKGAAPRQAGDWLALILCGGLGTITPLLRDALDGTAIFIFHSTHQYPGPPWSVVFNAIIATLAATRLTSTKQRAPRSNARNVNAQP